MRIKKFSGKTLRDATEQMKNELGPDAIVLNSRRVTRGGAMSFLGKDLFEITAAVDDALSPQEAPVTYGRRVPRPHPEGTEKRAARPADDPTRHLEKIAEQFRERERPRTIPHDSILELRSEIEEMKGAVKEIAEQLKYSRMPVLPDHLRDAYAHLLEQDVEEQLAADLVQSVYARLNQEQLADRKATREQLLQTIAGLFHTASSAKTRRRKSRIIALVGPTGVGKTTTIAKLAAIHKLVDRLSVALITADTYRIGAIDQLRTFASIADIPMEVVYRASEVPAALRKFREKDVILLDTVGRSQRSSRELAELSKIVAAAEPDEIHLVLSAATGKRTAMDVIRRFQSVKPNRLLISKLDEAATLGGLLNIAHANAMPMSYVTTGQNVPDDIRQADPAALASLIYAGEPAHA